MFNINIFSRNEPIELNEDPVIESTLPLSFQLSYFEKISLFIVCILGCYTCYSICFLFFPILSLKPRKFSLIWTLGSILFLLAFIILNGMNKFFSNAITLDRLPFTISFILSIITTLIFSLIYKSNILVIISCIIQFVCSLYYTISYFPYGREGLRMSSGLARSQVESWLS